MTTPTITALYARDLEQAFAGSYYTIAGAGGELADWVAGYNAELAEAGIGTPVAWFTTTGESVNAFAGEFVDLDDQFQPDLTFLLFPLDGLEIGRLAIFKVQWQDRWFDDVIQNMRRA